VDPRLVELFDRGVIIDMLRGSADLSGPMFVTWSSPPPAICCQLRTSGTRTRQTILTRPACESRWPGNS
jgi:hypothetical protein